MITRRHLSPLFAAAALAVLAGCADRAVPPTSAPGPTAVPDGEPLSLVSPGGLLYFGYVTGSEDTYSRAGTDSYANWGLVIDSLPINGRATARYNALAPHGQKLIVELGKVLWCNPPGYATLCPDYQARWTSWKAANPTLVGATTNKVLAFIIRDEPSLFNVSPQEWETAAAMVKRDAPNANILLIEAADLVADPRPDSPFNRAAGVRRTVDWVGAVKYGVRPDTTTVLRTAYAKLRSEWPAARTVYVGDAFYDANHAATLGISINGMGTIANEWYAYAARDPAAVLLAMFIWEPAEGATTARYFPNAVLNEHVAIGRAITGRARKRLYAPTGTLATVTDNGYVSGTACDPDGAWSEMPTLDVYNNGQLVATAVADQSNTPLSSCRSVSHGFRVRLPGTAGVRVSVVARDLDGGPGTELPTLPWTKVAWVQHSSVSWGQPNTLTAAGWARNGSGGVQLRWRDLTANGPTNIVPWEPVPATVDATWSNTIPVTNFCHDYSVEAWYSGVRSGAFTYRGLGSGFCNETARMIWIQPASTAGFGEPGSLVVAGEAKGAPSGTTVQMWYRNLTLGTGWTLHGYAAPTDGNGIWLNGIPNANPAHRYAVYAKYDVITTSTCTYAGTGGITWC